MRTVRFGRTEVELPVIGLGTWAHGGPNVVHGRPVGWFGVDLAEARATLVRAFEAGMVHWDTADVYGDGKAEGIIGDAFTSIPREKVFLASKVGWDPGSFSHYYHPAQIRRQLERSLKLLRTETIDLHYLHHCDFGPEGEYLDEAVEVLQRFREEGKIRFIGLSDWKCENILRYVELVDPDVVQCYRNVVDDTYESSGLKRWVEDHDLGVAFFSPFKHGLLLGTFEGPVTFGEGDHRGSLPEFRDYGLIKRLRACRCEVEKRFGSYEEPVFSALVGALLVESPGSIALVGQRRPQHVRAAALAGKANFTAEEARWIRQLYQENGRILRGPWKSYHQST